MGQPMQHHGVQTGVTSQDFPSAAGSRVTVKDALNVGANS
jgi:hypothetical protein